MKEKYGNPEKIIFFILLGVLLIAMPVLVNKAAVNNDILENKMQMLAKYEDDGSIEARDCTQIAESLRQEAQTPRTLSSVKSKRNIFLEQVYNKDAEIAVSDRPVLLVTDISFKPLEVEYRGRIFFEDGNDLVAQVNVHKKSYLVREGTRFAAFKVDELNDEFIKVTDKKGKILKIKYRQKTYTNELVAKIKELTSAYSKTVSKNSSFLEYKVLDIDEDSVLLSRQGQHLRLEKGMVHK